MGQRDRVTVYDIAEDSGLSIATVSRVLNNTGLVSQATQAKVAESVKKLGYRPSRGQALIPMENGVILVCIPSFTSNYIAEMIKGIKSSANRYGYQVVVYDNQINRNTLKQFLLLLKRLKCVGVIVTMHIDEESLKKIDSLVPVVTCNYLSPAYECTSVNFNAKEASSNIVNYLLSIGRKRIALINFPDSQAIYDDAYEGFIEAMYRFGMPVEKDQIVTIPHIDYNIALSAITPLFSGSDHPDAVIALSDMFAVSAMRAITSQGLKIPQDVALVGFDNEDYSSCLTPSLTSLEQPKNRMGFVSCELLVEKILEPDVPIKHITFSAELIIRESTMV